MSRQRFPWHADDLALLRELYPNTPTANLAGIFDRSVRSIYDKANSLGLKKSAEYMATHKPGWLDGIRGGATRFQKGHETWNKGQHYAAGGRSAETRFKPGHIGGSAKDKQKPIGTERISKDGYLERKISNARPFQRRWRGVHLLLWEAAHGPLPAGHAVAFIDGNKQNLALDNLQLISRRELMSRNTVHNYPKEIVDVIRLRAVINRKINRRSKQHEQ